MRLNLSISLSWLVLSASLARSESSGSTCSQLASTLPSSIFYPDTQTYNASLSSYPFLQLRLHPTCILRPTSVQDVVTAINILRESNCTKFAVRGGGHNANVGYNNIEDGVTIDMQSLNKVEVARGDQVVRVGAGAIWQNVYDEVEKKNLTVLGGRVGVVGTAGFLTGGGISFFSPEHGWACDAVLNFEVVLANGTLINANATSHTTLFAALKGGQANFGIVTRFDLKAYPATLIWGGRVVFAPNATIPFITAYSNMKLGTYDPYIAGWFTLRYNHSTATVNPVGIFWHTKPAIKPGALKPFVALPQEMNGIVEAPVSAHTRNASRAVTANPQRTIWATTTFRITPTVLHRIYAAWMKLVPAVGEQFAYAKVLQEITVQAVPALPKAGGPQNSLGFAATETPEKDLVFLQIMFHFEDGAAMEGLEVALEEFLEKIEDVARSEGVLHRWKYLNFAAAFQDPLASYGWERKSELRKVARKYDPRGLFQKQVPGGFKVSR